MTTNHCLNCHQKLEEILPRQDPPLFKLHDSIYDCLRALSKRVEILEDEIAANKMVNSLNRSSEPGCSNSIPITGFPKLK